MQRIDDEMLQRVAEQAELTPSYLTFMALAGILAAVALLANSVPILVGSMVVAPALAPLALVAFALAGGQPPPGAARPRRGSARHSAGHYLRDADDLGDERDERHPARGEPA